MTDLQKQLLKRKDDGLIRTQTDSKSLTIFNYTEKCNYLKSWDKYTLMARGLILNADGEIVARPFDKFFNLQEQDAPLNNIETLFETVGQPLIEEKMDGSLGILYWYYDKWHIATRGSFYSDQAKVGQSIINNLPPGFLDGIEKTSTHMFEIIYPSNRVVVNYGGMTDLVYLWSRDNLSGNYYKDFLLQSSFKTPKLYQKIENHIDNHEGYVLYFPDYNDLRVKIKFDEYVRLHRIMTGLSMKRIWSCLRNGNKIDLEGVPEEFAQEVKDEINQVNEFYSQIEKEAKECFRIVKNISTRKEQAKYIINNNKLVSSVVFQMLDGKDYSDRIWKMIEPKE